MSGDNPIQNDALTGLYVFFRSDDLPDNPSYSVYDTVMMNWSDPITLSVTLHDKEPLVYNGDPRAVYYKGKIYLFCRGFDDHVLAMKFDGTSWSDPVTLNDRSRDAITPYVMNGYLYIFYPGIDGPNPICCTKYDENFNAQNYWISKENVGTICPIGYCPDPGILFFNDNNRLKIINFNDNGFLGDGDYIGQNGMSFGPSTLDPSVESGRNFFRGLPGDPRLYEDRDGKTIDGINIHTGPSTVLLERGSSNILGIFYVNDDATRNLKMAIIQDDSAYKVLAIQNIDIPLAAGSSPWGLLI
ncbi:hypothetical protein PHO31112_02809 [Pandoraea horticolens]|uniref:Uncharacterized protein n=1 Tax=Pandoraea horticolens TaxID=2508298 RepID=A0A5E4VQN4_9BURK|nr:hypothetical protein [Pandoraea horticolens]VVE14658.1 hypothetical protein PHO31112_02809 [Pandoraea horticolens]